MKCIQLQAKPQSAGRLVRSGLTGRSHPRVLVQAKSSKPKDDTLSGVVFKPMEEVKIIICYLTLGYGALGGSRGKTLCPQVGARPACMHFCRGAWQQTTSANDKLYQTYQSIFLEPLLIALQVQIQLKEQSERGGLNDPRHSLVRMHYADMAEAAVNEQINVEYNISYAYHSMSAYFDRDNVSLPGIAKYFREQALEERSHAQKLIDFQNTRGGRVKLLPLVSPETEFADGDRGDALFAFELSLSLERLNYDKLLRLWGVMEEHADAQAAHFVEYMLEEQAEDIKETADYVSQLRRIGKDGHGVWQWDHEMYEGEIRYRAYAGGENGAA